MPLEGAAEGAPLAVQVADRWHLWHNLAGAVERAAARHRSCLRNQPPQPALSSRPSQPRRRRSGRQRRGPGSGTARSMTRWPGLTITAISRTLRLDRKTVRRYATAPTPAQLIPDVPPTRPGLLDPHLPYLHQRWADGVRSTQRLHQELRARGYTGSLRTLAPPHRPAAPGHHHSRTTASASRQEDGQMDPRPRRATSPTPTTPNWRRSPHAAPNWQPPRPWSATSPRCSATATANTCQPGPPRPRPAPSASCADSPKDTSGKNWAAVTAGLTLPYSSGAVEGHVNRIKMINCDVRTSETSRSANASCSATSRPRQLGQSHLNLAVDRTRTRCSPVASRQARSR